MKYKQKLEIWCQAGEELEVADNLKNMWTYPKSMLYIINTIQQGRQHMHCPLLALQNATSLRFHLTPNEYPNRRWQYPLVAKALSLPTMALCTKTQA